MVNPFQKLLRVALAIGPASEIEASLKRMAQKGQSGLQFSPINGLEPLAMPYGQLSWDLLLAELNYPGLQWKLQNSGIHCPVVILAEPSCEGEALELLETGQISDYVLTSQAQLKRLPLVLKAAAARGRIRGDWHADGPRGVLQEAVYQIAEASEKAESLDALLPRIHEIVGRVMPAGNFYIALYDPAADTLHFPYFVDEKDVLEETTYKARRGLTEFVLHSGKSLLVAKNSQLRLAISGEVDAVGPPSEIWLGVPLIVDGSCTGAMVVQHYSDPEAYGEVEQRMLEFVSSQVAMVIRRRQDQDALRASEERYRGVFENTNVGLGRLTPEGRVLLANPALIRMVGCASLEELQKLELVSGGDAASSRRFFLDQLAKKGELRGYESTWRKADGSTIYVREDAHMVTDASGQPLYFESLVEDISERRRAELSLQEKLIALQSLAEIDREVLAADNAQSILELVCDRMARLLHVPKAVILTGEDFPRNFMIAAFGFNHPNVLKDRLSVAAGHGLLDRLDAFSIADWAPDNPVMREVAREEELRAVAGEPFSTTSGLKGMLMALDTRPRAWTEDEVQLVRLLAGQVALALEKISLLNSARRRASEFAGLLQVAGGLMGRRDIHALLSLIVEKAAGLYQASDAFIYMYDEKNQEVRMEVSSSADMGPGVSLKLGEGLAGRVAQTREPMIVKDYQEWAGHVQAQDGRQVHGVIEVPMLFDGNLIGILGVESTDPVREFNKEDLGLLSLLAEQAASAISNARLFSRLQDRNRELDRLSRVSSMLLAGISSDATSLCRSIAELLVSEFNYSNCSIWLVGEDDLTLVRGAAAGPYSGEIQASLLTVHGPGVIAKSLRTNTPINLGDVSLSPDYISSWSRTRSELSVPMRSGERRVGVIDLQSDEPDAYGPDDVRLLELIASRAALMLEHVYLYQQTEHRLQQLTVLSNIDAAIASSLDLQVTLNILVSQISMHLRADAVDVLLFNPHLQMLEYAIGRGFRGSGVRRVSLLLGEDQAGHAAIDRSVVSVVDLTSPQVVLSRPERISGEDFISMFAVPLIAKGQLKGVLELFFRSPAEANPDWINFLETLARQAAVAVEDARLFNDMQRSSTDQNAAYDASVEAWARLSAIRLREPGWLLGSLEALTLRLARYMSLPQESLPHLHRGVLLHDIGKLTIPDIILLKDGPLSEEEWGIVRTHPTSASELLQPIAFLRPAIPIPYCQHEKWDGSGYPRGLRGKEIPLEARIFAVVNVWVMLQCERPHRAAWDRQQATSYVQQQSGAAFDPDVVAAFLKLLPELEDLREEIMDSVPVS